jgi:hypothetical protein
LSQEKEEAASFEEEVVVAPFEVVSVTLGQEEFVLWTVIPHVVMTGWQIDEPGTPIEATPPLSKVSLKVVCPF